MGLQNYKIRPDQKFTVENDGFYGSYFEPVNVQFPGKSMIVCTGADGNFYVCQFIAEAFRRAGMPSMAVAYWNAPGTPKEDLESPVEYVQRAAKWLRKEKAFHVGVWGISLGGEYALLSGSVLSEIECVVAVSPVHVVTECGGVKGGFHFAGGSPFSWRGRPVPCVLITGEKKREYKKRVMEHFRKDHEFNMRFVYEEQLRQVHNTKADIRVEYIQGPVLLLSGGEDTCVPADWVCNEVIKRLNDKGFKYPAVHHNYEHLSHYVTPIHLLSAGLFRSERKYKKECKAERQKSWEDTLYFLREDWKIKNS